MNDLRKYFGTRDLRRQSDADRYMEKLYHARVLLNRVRRAAARHRHTRGWWLVA